jgi:hypothetical protein
VLQDVLLKVYRRQNGGPYIHIILHGNRVTISSKLIFISFSISNCKLNFSVVDQTLPCPKLHLGYPKPEVRFGISQTGISILDDLAQV